MNADQLQQVEVLFQAALERAPAERAAFLAAACGSNAALLAQVQTLLSAHERSGNLTEMLPQEVTAPEAQTTMTFGRQLGAYHVTTLLGRGGMGEVYLAEDTRLGRQVALKLLPREFTRDVDRVRRFEREARAASALNHPNIITIYDLGRADDTYFIATELVAGQTLRQQMVTARPSLPEALAVITQIASALTAAHQAGVIHRDIKPDNVMIRPDGLVKVLDFGLAKLIKQPPLIAANGTTSLNTGTTPGVVIGTLPYMSPEQVRGLVVDARTDIFALGVILYELVAGHRPFAGETSSDLIAAILSSAPPPLAQVVPEVPAELQHIVSRALRKKADERYQTSQELLTDLKDLQRNLEFATQLERVQSSQASGKVTPVKTGVTVTKDTQETAVTRDTLETTISPGLSGVTNHRKLRLGTALALSLIILAGIGIALYSLLSRSAPAPATPFQTMKLTRVTTNGNVLRAAISPDGKYIAHVVDDGKGQSLWVKQVVTGVSAQIIPPADDAYQALVFSPDSNYVYYVQDTGLYRVAVLGGAPRRITREVLGQVAPAPDGKRLAIVRSYADAGRNDLIIINVDGTGEQRLVSRQYPDGISSPTWSLDNKLIAYLTVATDANSRYANVALVSAAGGAEQLLTANRWPGLEQVSWLADGSGLLLTAADEASNDTQIWHLSYPGQVGRRVTNDLHNYSGVSATSDASALVSVQTDQISNIWVVPNAQASQARQLTFGLGKLEGVMGLDGINKDKIIYISRASGTPDLWSMNADGSNQTQLTTNGKNNIRPALSPDGRYIAFSSNIVAEANIWRIDSDGSNLKRLTSGDGEAAPHWSPDGRWIVYQGLKDGKPLLWKLAIDGGAPMALTSTSVGRPVISPDGKLIACYYYDEQDASAAWKLGVIPFDGGPPIKLLALPKTVDRLTPLRWTADGRGLTFIDTHNGVSNIWRQPLEGGAPQRLTDFQTGLLFNFAWAGDGKQLVCARGVVNKDVVLISNFK
jgi:eukaryotic-like serine/threonine-protein kinase